MTDWLVVLNNRESVAWVLREHKMAFRDGVGTKGLTTSDRFVLYTTRGTYSSPNTDESQVIAYGHISGVIRLSTVEVGQTSYPQWCPLKIATALTPRSGVPVRPLVEKLGFISNKKTWWAYVHQTLARLGDGDFELLRKEIDSRDALLRSHSETSIKSGARGNDQGLG